MRRKSEPIETSKLCAYGCGQTAKFVNGSGKLMCASSHNSCPANRQKNSISVKGCGRNYVDAYKALPQETKDRMAWSRGLTNNDDPRLARPQQVGRRWGASLTGHTEESKKKISAARTEWLKKSENRKNLGRHKRSWMELNFESYLVDNNITGWESEVHFWNPDARKNYYPDFLFESRKLIVELDGTQHRKTVDLDAVRDQWFTSQGYTVIRISHTEFKERLFSGKGFNDLLAFDK